MCAMPQCLRRYLRQPSSRTPRRTQAFLRPRSPCQHPFNSHSNNSTSRHLLCRPRPSNARTCAKPADTRIRIPSPCASSSADLLGSTRDMRSVWDRLSSSAGAALSAVQDAYGTVCDVRARDASSGGSGGLFGEIQDWSAPPSVNAASTLDGFFLAFLWPYLALRCGWQWW